MIRLKKRSRPVTSLQTSQVVYQPRSQGLSSYRLLAPAGKLRDPGNEVGGLLSPISVA